MATIASINEVLSYLGEETQTDTNTLERIRMVHRFAERAVRRYIGANVIQTAYTHYLPSAARLPRASHSGPILRLPEFPVRSITKLYEDTSAYAGQASGAYPESSLLTPGVDYYLVVDDDGVSWFGHVVRLGGSWPSIGGSVKVVYTAGRTAAELDGDVTNPRLDASDIKLAVLKAVGENMIRRDQHSGDGGPVESEKLDDWSATYAIPKLSKKDDFVLPRDTKQLLRPYRRVVA